MKHIASRQNPVITRYRSVARGEKAGDRKFLVLDGPHLVDEALAAGLSIQHALVAADAVNRPDMATIVSSLEARNVELHTASPSVLNAASPVQSPSGIVAIAIRPSGGEARIYGSARPLVVIACDVQDPGNLGAIVRVAEAAGAAGVVAAGMCADPFGWKALRGSMGSALRLPIAVTTDTRQAVADAVTHGCRTVAAVPRDGESLFEVDLAPPLAILIGGEGAGLPPALIDKATLRVTIPMQEPVESLNAAVTAAILVYEARRQRN
jgi:TrmH family RNA methyltransferase